MMHGQKNVKTVGMYIVEKMYVAQQWKEKSLLRFHWQQCLHEGAPVIHTLLVLLRNRL
jgi:hypothetical protein